MKLEQITNGMHITGIETDTAVAIEKAEMVGADTIAIIYRNADGQLREQILQRYHEQKITEVESSLWDFSGKGDEFILALESRRIQLAHLFDPMMAIHTSNIEPLPHQISAVYESMLPNQPLRYVLADDPGAGKTIMAGLLMRELIVRGDAQRILIVTPGSLVEQWQDELQEKFNLEFEIFSRQVQETISGGNFFAKHDRVIVRIDQLARNEDYQEKLQASNDWDLVIVDEAHKMSASFYGNEIKKTKRFYLGESIGQKTRHLLLMTATPHRGKEEDFQLFLSLLDSDRFYGKFRDGVAKTDVSDIMRRMVKEDLLKFDGTRLFPERRSYSMGFELSMAEKNLYHNVSEYVRQEMNRADRLTKKRKNNVGFALTMLQRRLASSPYAIYRSLQRRRQRLQKKLTETDQPELSFDEQSVDLPEDFDELTGEEYEQQVDLITDQASTAETKKELEMEIASLTDLEQQAKELVESGEDCKWVEVRKILHDKPEMRTADGSWRKLIIFTEHRDTLSYLYEKISDVYGNREMIVTIHGGKRRDLRAKVQTDFKNDPNVKVLLATDAAGEGVNLQNSHLMINYDLPWNPNRLEQRFGRIHRIGQQEVCHLWNMIARDTREGQVFERLFEKLEIQKKSLGGKVFDILGEAFSDKSLNDILLEAICYSNNQEVQAKINERIDNTLEASRLQDIIKKNSLIAETMTSETVYQTKEKMDRAEARKLQPYFVKRFFCEAFTKLGGSIKAREKGRWAISYIPQELREYDRLNSKTRTPIARQYKRICFEKDYLYHNKVMAELLHPATPLMQAVIGMSWEKYRHHLRQGAILVDPNDDSIEPQIICLIEHDVKERNDKARLVSRKLKFIKIDKNLHTTDAGHAPHLDLRPVEDSEHNLVKNLIADNWLTSKISQKIKSYASDKLATLHFAEVEQQKKLQADKIEQAVHQRLTTEINHWQSRYLKLTEDVEMNLQPRMQPENALRKSEELQMRLTRRKRELQIMRDVISVPPKIVGGALVIPNGLLAKLSGKPIFSLDSQQRKFIEKIAIDAVVAKEQSLGHKIKDVSADNCGWDLTSIDTNGKHRHIEVKGRAKGQTTITVTANEILAALNQGDKFILAIVIIDGECYEGPHYVQQPFTKEPDFAERSKNLSLNELLQQASQV